MLVCTSRHALGKFIPKKVRAAVVSSPLSTTAAPAVRVAAQNVPNLCWPYSTIRLPQQWGIFLTQIADVGLSCPCLKRSTYQ